MKNSQAVDATLDSVAATKKAATKKAATKKAATKKAATKKAATKKETKPRGATFQPTKAGANVNPKDLGTQEQLIFATLMRGKATVAELAAKVAGKLETRQPVKKVVAFYMSKWRSEKLVMAVK